MNSNCCFSNMSCLTQSPDNQYFHRFWSLIYIRKGIGMYLLEGELKTLNEGDLLFLPPGLDYSFSSATLGDEYNVNIDASVFRFDESWLDALLSVFHEMNDVILKIKEIRSAISVIGLKWMSLSTLINESAVCDVSQRPQKILQILSLLSDRKDMVPLTESVCPQDSVSDRIRMIEQYIDCNVYRKISLDEISSYSGLNRTYFSLFFKRHFKMSLTDYINIKKVGIASDILLSSDEPVSYISSQCGFTTVNYFNRIFKNITGVTPREYRIAHKMLDL